MYLVSILILDKYNGQASDLDVLLYKSLLFKLPLTQSIMLILVIRQIFKFSITKRTTKFDLIFILDFKYST